MADIQDLSVNYLLRKDFDEFTKASKKDALPKGKTPLDYLTAMYQEPEYRSAAAEWESLGNIAGGAAVAWLGTSLIAPWLAPAVLFSFIGSLIDGTRSVKIILVNDTNSDIMRSDYYEDCGEEVLRPVWGKTPDRIPKRQAQVNDPTDSKKVLLHASVFYGCYAFRKATTLGIGFEGTEGVLRFSSQDASVLPKGACLGWSVPESGKNNCVVSVNSGDAKAVHSSWLVGNDRRTTDSSGNKTSNVKMYCAIDSISDSEINLVAVLTDGMAW